jgi:translocation and assembly module TamA
MKTPLCRSTAGSARKAGGGHLTDTAMPTPVASVCDSWRACLAGALLALFACAAVAEGPGYRVDISAPEKLADLLRQNLDLVRWSTRGDVTEDQLRQLVKTAPEQARELLATEGYFSPQVRAALERGASDWRVSIDVKPGEPTRIASIEFSVSGAIESDPQREARIADARKAFAIKQGEVFRQSEWDGGKQRALGSLQRRLYASAQLTESRAHIDPDAREARLEVRIDSGPPFSFGALDIQGLQRYEPSIVHNLSPIRAGDPFDEEALLRLQRRLLVSDYFVSAVVSAGRDPSQAAATPVIVRVVEGTARRVELGAGFSTDRGARFQAGYTDHNLLDRAWRLNSQVKVDRLSSEVLGGVTFPRDASGWRYGIEGRNNEQDIQGEQRIDWSVTGARTFAVEDYESQLALQLVNEKRLISDGPEDNRKATFVSQAWTWNRIDDLLAPRDGFAVRLQVGGAGAEMGSDRSFGRVIAKGTYLQPVGGFGTLLFRLEGGAVIAGSRENIPSVYLFRTGGDTTVRGYAFESLGVQQDAAVVGGRYLAVGSVEYIQWLTREWGAAVFYDAGNAGDDRRNFRVAEGYGAGVRWYSPVGALSLDVAYGEQTDEYRLHFSAGFTFR